MQTSIYQQIATSENLEESWKLVRRNQGAPGIDWENIQNMEKQWDTTKEELLEQLKRETYSPAPGRRVYIPKTNGKKRALGIPTVRDRIIQQAIRRIIEPQLDPDFEDFSYGFRPGKSAKQALGKVDEILESGLCWVIQIDLEQFFDTIPHSVIMEVVGKKIKDEEIYRIIEKFLKAGVIEDFKYQATTTGTPQGGVISPLLANLVLDGVDKYVRSHGDEGMVRYADDFVILCKTKRRAMHVMKEVITVLKKLGLRVNEEKSKTVHISEGFEFLGYQFWGGKYEKGDGGTIITPKWKRPSKKAIQAFREKIRLLTRRQQPKNVRMLKERLNPLVRGWGNYFNAGFHKSLFGRLDGWYRTRLRSFIHKKRSIRDNIKYPISVFQEMGYFFLSDLLVPE
jgi:group II intron reverse transcriptase/maturase